LLKAGAKIRQLTEGNNRFTTGFSNLPRFW